MNEKNPSTPPEQGDQSSGELVRLECDIAPPGGNTCSHEFFEAVEHGSSLIGQCNKCGFRPIHGIDPSVAAPTAPSHHEPIDANALEQMARERPDDCFLKGSGILKLTGAIRHLEGMVAELGGTIAPSGSALVGQGFQQRVLPWMMACFGETISNDLVERNHRFLEEALELVQSTGCTQSEAHQLVDYVFGRPVGEQYQEVGGVMVTLAALCLAAKLDMHAAAETELARVWTKVDVIRAKQAAKPKHSPLPQHVATRSDLRNAVSAWPEGLLERVKSAEQRIIDGHSLRRIPADPTDVDMVLAEVRDLIEGKWPPSWLKFTPEGGLYAEVARLNQIVNSPQSGDFLRAVSTEGEHQRQRWGSSHDAGKTAADWFWLVGHLAGKALHAHAAGNLGKAEHHVITTAAALLNWHMAMFGKTDMRPGIDGARHNLDTEGRAA